MKYQKSLLENSHSVKKRIRYNNLQKVYLQNSFVKTFLNKNYLFVAQDKKKKKKKNESSRINPEGIQTHILMLNIK